MHYLFLIPFSIGNESREPIDQLGERLAQIAVMIETGITQRKQDNFSCITISRGL